MRMLFLTDLHESVVYLRAVQRRVLEAGWRPDLVVVGGDISSFGGVAQARPLLNFIRSTWDRVLAVAGNTDLPEVAEWLGSLGVDLAGRGLVVGDVGFVGCQGSNWTPLGTPNERSEGVLADELERGWQDLSERDDWRRLVVVSHVPPRDTAADVVSGGEHVGSVALREFIRERQPDLCLCGHIHEASGLDWIGRTQVLNPGPLCWGRFGWVELGEEGAAVCHRESVHLPAWRRMPSALREGSRKLAGFLRWKVSVARSRAG